MKFKEELKKYQELVNKELNKYIKKNKCYEERLNSSMEYSLIAGGKRLRAILMIDTYKLFKNDFEKCIPFSMALEIIHNFSLIHDDLPEIDDDDFRHGKPTNHKKFDHATALLAGDSLLNQAYNIISEEIQKDVENSNYADLENKVKAFKEFTIAVDRMIAGEYLDTEAENKETSKELLEYIHKNKTGELLKLSVRTGAILAGAKETEIEQLSGFAERIGLAFQIKDDILSEEGNQEVMGKPVGNDKEHHKCTYVTCYGLENAKEELNKNINEALEYLKEYGEKAEFLIELTYYIKNRNK